MRRIGLIGGTGSAVLRPETARRLEPATTPWGDPSGALHSWRQGCCEVLFLPRHGEPAGIAPHRVNYRANVWTLREQGVEAVLGINAVGGITPRAVPGTLLLPDQLIDYTWGREPSFCDGTVLPLRHVEFDPPFDGALRSELVAAARIAGIDLPTVATYGVTQGPRLETAAEIDRLAADGCDLVGMTAMPEAALAREAGLRYALCAAVVNRAAGRLPPGGSIHGEMAGYLAAAMSHVARLLDAFCAA